MKFSTSFFSLAFMASAALAATFRSEFAEQAYKKALEKGIDPHGDHPKDFLSDDGKVRKFHGESNYALWVAAQDARTDLEKRRLPQAGQQSGMDVVMWTDQNCKGPGINNHYYDIVYNSNYWDGKNGSPILVASAIQILNTGIQEDIDELQIKNWLGGNSKNCNDLGKPFTSQGPGCYNTPDLYTCFQLHLLPIASSN
ncbi:hypothetical protein BDD12DRAFT_906003 [Trichophaea hybrida]|nr:hypothetical protein BDD12DRAFT_906003 [Trichophaea hybrida]